MNVQSIASKRGRKIEQVLEGARTVFMADGFEGASVDDIAKTAGVSKATLYSYFPDKKLLFMEVARLECLRMAENYDQVLHEGSDVRIALKSMGMDLMTLITSDFGLNVFRICVAESDRFPELGRQFFENGPMKVRAMTIDYLDQQIAAGKLKIKDCALAADQFAEMCKADIFPCMVFGIDQKPSKDRIEHIVDEAVETFMARYEA
ncbi:TetR/AcrR family transcriptional regulator [Aestuariibius sp. 2305UL40-4]|uniref:TetR/AcrR family transcriptional regulator n=1 Tax=Aestuariibius violaceus TaxID=3234132 RepID=UPI00345EF654